jgi:sulfide dehydrogenase cytochrome subunit
MPCRRLALIAALLSATSAFAAKPKKIPPPPAAAKVCEECHGANGVATAAGIPYLNGQIPEIVVDSMKKFREGKRPSSTPLHADPGMSDQEIEALAKYYGAQGKAERPVQPADPAKVAAAGSLYSRRCAKCHIDDGRESDHDAPLMAGQSLEYLQAQTEAFVKGKRKFPYLMDDAYQGLSAEDLEKLSHYFAGQKSQ